jgi:hypothetical protein
MEIACTEEFMSGRVYLLGVGVALVALAFLLTDALVWEPGVTEANVRRIRPGMSLDQVEAILGEKGIAVDLRDNPPGRPPSVPWLWSARTGAAWVRVGAGGRVESASWMSCRPEPSPFARLRAWLGW